MTSKIQKKRQVSLKFVSSVFMKFNYIGLLGAVAAFCTSFLPSLLPRPWLFQGFVTGVSLAIGYGVGCFISWTIRWLIEWEPSSRVKSLSWKMLAVLAPVLAAGYLYAAAGWQEEVSRLVGMEPQANRYIFRILLVSLLVGSLLLYLSRIIRFCSRKIIDLIDKILPRKISIIIGCLTVVYLVITLLNGLMFSSFVRFSNNNYRDRNSSAPTGVTKPIVKERSGGEGSFVEWDTLGYQGKNFVGRGPSLEQLQNLGNEEVIQPIRVYAGVDSADTIADRAALVLKELERTGAFERDVLVVANATGTGWLEPQAVDSLEYMYGGNTAIASVQYSYLPSWLSFLVNKQEAKDAGQELFNSVYGKWIELPEDKRPKLIVYGLSLGSYAAQSAFSGANDLKYTTDGALFVGTPSDTELWNTITKGRDKGSRQIDPDYKNGSSIRFVDDEQDFNEDDSSWGDPRTLYLQHPSDPVVWFDFDLILNKPDWLSEARGDDVSPSMQWYPFITFTQVALDQFLGNSPPSGHGHQYGTMMISAWASVVPPSDWDQNKADKLQVIIDSYSNE